MDTNVASRSSAFSPLARAREALKGRTKRIEVVERGSRAILTVTQTGAGRIRNRFGDFLFLNFEVDDRWRSYHVLAAGCRDEFFNPVFRVDRALLLRLDSGCLTGQLFADERCDCRAQLELAMTRIVEHGQGLVVHIPGQEGRGLGLDVKLAALQLDEDLGLDTYAATTLLTSGAVDLRSYAGAVGVLKVLGIPGNQEIALLTNNPEKLNALAENGFGRVVRVRCWVEAGEHAAKHLNAKRAMLGHLE